MTIKNRLRSEPASGRRRAPRERTEPATAATARSASRRCAAACALCRATARTRPRRRSRRGSTSGSWSLRSRRHGGSTPRSLSTGWIGRRPRHARPSSFFIVLSADGGIIARRIHARCRLRLVNLFLRDRGDRAKTGTTAHECLTRLRQGAHWTLRPVRHPAGIRIVHARSLRPGRQFARAPCHRGGRGGARERGLVRSRQSGARRGQAGRAPARHRGADARGDAGDRGLEPALRRASRPLHDRDADVQFRHRDAEDHRGDLHPGRPPARHRALRRAAPVHDRRQQAGPQLPDGRHRRNRADGSARRGDRPRSRSARAHRHRGRPGVARHFRSGGRRRRPVAVLQGHRSRRSAARAT